MWLALTPRLDLYLFCAWMMIVPLPFGSNRTWALALTLPPLFALAIRVAWRKRETWTSSFAGTLTQWPNVCLLGFILVLVAQLVPIGGSALSIVPHQTTIYLLVALACATCCWLTTHLITDESDLKLLLYAMLACGTLQAMIGVFMHGANASFSMLGSQLTTEVVTGTYLNQNHLAGYLNMCLAAGIGLLMGQLALPKTDRTWRQAARDWVSLSLSSKARIRLILVLMVIALILTHSRMGNFAFMSGLLVAAAVYAIFAGERRRGLLILIGSLLVIDIVLIGAWVGVGKVIDRVTSTSLVRSATGSGDDRPTDARGASAPAETSTRTEESVEQRIDPAYDAIDIIKSRPILGTGGGTFYIAFTNYADRDLGYYNHAHNDYLEIATDTGLLGFGLLLAFALNALWTAVRVLWLRRNDTVRAAAYCSLMSIICMGLHSFVDFNLQIPANAMMFTIVLTLPMVAKTLRTKRRRGTSKKRDKAQVPKVQTTVVRPLSGALPQAISASATGEQAA